MADTIIAASLTLDGSQAVQSVKSIKSELRDATNNLVEIQKQFGEVSPEAINAAKAVAQLRDRIQDAKKLTDAFNPDQKFAAFSSVLRTVTGGFSALTGTMALFGSQNKDVEQAILKVQAALAISEGVNTIGEAVKGFKNLGAVIQSTTVFQAVYNLATKAATAIQAAFGIAVDGTSVAFSVLRGAIISTGIGALVVGLGFAIEKIIEWTSKTDEASDAQARLDEVVKKFNQTLSDNLTAIQFNTKARELLLKEQGANDQELFNNRISGLLQELQAIKKHNEDLRAEGRLSLDDRKKESDKENEITLARLQFESDAAVKERQQADQAEKEREQKAKEAADKRKQELEAWQKQEEEAYWKRKKLDDGGVVTYADMQADIDARATIEQKALDEEVARQNKSVKDRIPSLMAWAQANIDAANQIKINDDIAYHNKIELLKATSGALQAFSNLLGQQTVAGKVLGIATATINTFIGATEVLRAKSVLPEPWGTVAKIANVAAVIATGLAAVKNIVKVQVPGGGGGAGASVPSVSSLAPAPLKPSPQVGTTQLPQDQINQIGNAAVPVRAFVVEADISKSQQQISRLNRQARLGG